MCYTCLLGGSEVKLLRGMQKVARLRRVVWIVCSQDAPLRDTDLLKLVGKFSTYRALLSHANC